MSSKTTEAIISIANFIRGKKPPLPFAIYYLPSFEHRMQECIKRNPSFEDDFIKFLSRFDPAEPKRGTNVHSTDASKTEIGRRGYSGRRGYRVIYYYDKDKHIVVFIALYAKNEKTDIDHHEANMIGEVVRRIKEGKLELIPLG